MYILRYRGTQHRPWDKNAAMASGRRPTAVLQSSSKGLCWKLPNSHTRPYWAALVHLSIVHGLGGCWWLGAAITVLVLQR